MSFLKDALFGTKGTSPKFKWWAQKQYRKGLPVALAAQDENIALAKQTGGSMLATVEDTGKRAQGRLSQDLSRRGLSNTTVFDAGQRGIRSDTNRMRMMVDDWIRQNVAQANQNKIRLLLHQPTISTFLGKPATKGAYAKGLDAFYGGLGSSAGGGAGFSMFGPSS